MYSNVLYSEKGGISITLVDLFILCTYCFSYLLIVCECIYCCLSCYWLRSLIIYPIHPNVTFEVSRARGGRGLGVEAILFHEGDIL